MSSATIETRTADGISFSVAPAGFPLLDRPLTYEARYRYLDFSVRVRANSDDVEQPLRRALGAPAAGGRDTLDVTVFVHEEAPSAGFSPIARFWDEKYVVVNGASFGVADCRAGTVTVHVAAGELRDDAAFGKRLLDRLLDTYVLRHESIYTFHAAAVGVGDRFALVTAARGTGKSTLAYACVRQGMTLLADDLVARYVGDAPGRVWGRPGVTYVDPIWAARYPELETVWLGRPRTNGKLRTDLQELWPDRLAGRGQLAALVFLERASATAIDVIDPESFDGALELRYLAHSHEDEREERIATDLDALLDGVPVHRLSVADDPDEAAPLLRDALAA